ncbi:MAG: RNA 2'-phosphotransferase [Flavobacteriales bacterium]|nr:RNA 2'-phosphotransferase [Flavobacteriales bacterium]
MNEKALKQASKFLSLVLRHQPELIGLRMDENGWVDVDQLISKAAAQGMTYTPELIAQLVRESDKQRFALSRDGERIRANQGHSVEVDLGYQPTEPPGILFHGTAARNWPSIQEQGLLKGERHHVHLSAERETALKVGQRHGTAVVLVVDSARMHHEGFVFFRSTNGVWLTDAVPAPYVSQE